MYISPGRTVGGDPVGACAVRQLRVECRNDGPETLCWSGLAFVLRIPSKNEPYPMHSRFTGYWPGRIIELNLTVWLCGRPSGCACMVGRGYDRRSHGWMISMRGVALFLSLALIAVALAACGGDGVTTAPEASDGEGRQSERESRAGTHAPRRPGTRRRERQPAHHRAGGDGGGWRRHAHAGRRRWRAKGQVHIGQRRGVTPAG